MSNSARERIFALPKAELHVHAEATLQPELLMEIAERNGIGLPYRTTDDVRAALEFPNLEVFLETYYAHIGVLTTAQDFLDLVTDYGAAAAAQGVRHFEMFFDPQAHIRRGIAPEIFLEGLDYGVRECRMQYGMSGELILSFLRDLPEGDAIATFDRCLATRPCFIGVGLDSAEVEHPPAKFKRAFEHARIIGMRLTAHAGEEGPAAYIKEAIDELAVERIDHGVRCTEDHALVESLARSRLPLTTCPLSNVQLKVFDDITAHNAVSLLRRGLAVTVNSDGPAFFGGYIGDNYLALAAVNPDLTWAEVVGFASNSFSGSFLPESEKDGYLAELNEFAETLPLDDAVGVA